MSNFEKVDLGENTVEREQFWEGMGKVTLIWKSGHEEHYPVGRILRGLTHNGERALSYMIILYQDYTHDAVSYAKLTKWINQHLNCVPQWYQ